MEFQDQLLGGGRAAVELPISGTQRPASGEGEAYDIRSFYSTGLPDDDQYFGDLVRGKSRIFADPEQMKKDLRKKILKDDFRAEHFYHDSGRCVRVARSRTFEHVTTVMILLNAVWIGIDVEFNHEDLLVEAKPIFQVAENLFCTYFFAEVLIRFLAYRLKRNVLKDGWFLFDASLVVLMVLEVWVLTLFCLAFPAVVSDGRAGAFSDFVSFAKFVRLARLFRMARLLRAFPELLILIKGMMAAIRSVIFTLALLFLIAYVFGIMFKSLAEKSEDLRDQYFSTLGLSIQTLLVQGTFLDNLADLVDALTADAKTNGTWYLLIFFYVYIFLSSLTVMNMLIGVICEAIETVATVEREELMLNTVKVKLKQVMDTRQARRGTSLSSGDASQTMTNSSHHITKDDFRAMLRDEEAARCLNDVGVDVVSLVDIADFLFEDPRTQRDRDQISFLEFVDVILRFRGTNWVTVKDLVETRRFVHASIRSLEDKVVSRIRGDQSFESRSPSHQDLRSNASGSRSQYELQDMHGNGAWEPLPEQVPASYGVAASAEGRRMSLPASLAAPSMWLKDRPPLVSKVASAPPSNVAEVQEALSGLQRAFQSFLETAGKEASSRPP